jgi:ferric-dicitrate binding protein FerR (iron transport regulator)
MGLKDRLAARRRPTATYALRIDDDTTARAELGAARAAGDESRIVAAQEAVEACYEQVTLTALPPVDLEALIAAHPPPKQLQGQKIFNSATFIPALLAVSVDSDVSEGDWAEYYTSGAMTTGEVAHLFEAVWSLNHRPPDPALPKD